MAKNWSAAEAAQVVFEGKDKAAIQDIGKRFPLFVSAAARGAEGLLEIISVLHPERITARTIEAKLKEGVEEIEDDAEEVEEKATKKEKEEKPAAKEKGKKEEKKGKKDEKPAKKNPPKKEEPEEDEDWDDEEEEDEEEDGETALEDMSLAELKAEAKKRKVNIKGLKKPKDIIKAIKAAEEDTDEEDEDEDEDDDWDL